MNKKRKEYIKNPNHCKYCNSIIKLNDGDKLTNIKRKTFCNRSCSASFNNKNVSRKLHNECKSCGKQIDRSITFCSHKCNLDFLFENGKVSNTTKDDLFNGAVNWQSARSTIVKHANSSFDRSNKKRKCIVCGYDNIINVSHIKAVKDFHGDSLIKEINHPDNLIALCPNHHWEFDNGILLLGDRVINCLS